MPFHTRVVNRVQRIDTTVGMRVVLHTNWPDRPRTGSKTDSFHTPVRRSATARQHTPTKRLFELHNRMVTTLPTTTAPNTGWKSAKDAKSEYGLTPHDLRKVTGVDVLYGGRGGRTTLYNPRRLEGLREEKACASHQRSAQSPPMSPMPLMHPMPPMHPELFIPNAMDYSPGMHESLVSFPLLGYQLAGADRVALVDRIGAL